MITQRRAAASRLPPCSTPVPPAQTARCHLPLPPAPLFAATMDLWPAFLTAAMISSFNPETLGVPMAVLASIPLLASMRTERAKTNFFPWLMEHAKDAEWRLHMRINRNTFGFLCDSIAQHKAFRVPINVGKRAVSLEKQVAAFLFRAGGLSVNRTACLLDIGMHTVCQCTTRVVRALLDVHREELTLPTNGSEGARRVLRAFRNKDFPGCRGIIDCTHIPIVVATKVNRAGHRWAYMKKGQGSPTKTYQVIVDTEMRVLSVEGGQAGRTHDTTVLAGSKVFRDLHTYVQDEHYFMGDCGYKLRRWMQHGYTRPELLEGQQGDKEYYNARYSGVRITVERVFGGALLSTTPRARVALPILDVSPTLHSTQTLPPCSDKSAVQIAARRAPLPLQRGDRHEGVHTLF